MCSNPALTSLMDRLWPLCPMHIFQYCCNFSYISILLLPLLKWIPVLIQFLSLTDISPKTMFCAYWAEQPSNVCKMAVSTNLNLNYETKTNSLVFIDCNFTRYFITSFLFFPLFFIFFPKFQILGSAWFSFDITLFNRNVIGKFSTGEGISRECPFLWSVRIRYLHQNIVYCYGLPFETSIPILSLFCNP